MSEIFLFKLNEDITEFDAVSYSYVLVRDFEEWCNENLACAFTYEPSSILSGEDILPFRTDYWLAVTSEEDAIKLMLTYSDHLKLITSFFTTY